MKRAGRVAACPDTGGGHERLGFAGNPAAEKIGDEDDAAMAEAADAGDASLDFARQLSIGQHTLEAAASIGRHRTLPWCLLFHALPKMDGIAQASVSDLAQPDVMFPED